MKNQNTHISGPPSPSGVVVALSGGVDSAFAATLLKRAGWDVHGLHFLIPSSQSVAEVREKSARQTAEFLKIPFEVMDIRDLFENLIIDPFVKAYMEGLTPNPCVSCNGIIKFDNLSRHADSRGISYIATGHYVRKGRDETGTGLNLLRGTDTNKDQSYFLHRLKPSDLSRAVFPLGELKKGEVRESARHMGIPAHASPESQEICFIPENDYRRLIKERMPPGASPEGNIVGPDGKVIGRHKGVFGYTVGQRQGLRIASDRPFYVKKIMPSRNEIMVARRESLYSKMVEAKNFNWMTNRIPEEVNCHAQIRYRHKAAFGLLEVKSPGHVAFTFDRPQWAVTPGQALVCYDGDRLIGGGWISS